MELSIFEEAGEALRGLAPPELGEYRHRAHLSQSLPRKSLQNALDALARLRRLLTS